MAGEESSSLERAIQAQVEEWSSNSTEIFEISLYRGDKPEETFEPVFTYPIFGEDEAIFGYQGLKISLAFAAHNLKPHLQITYDRKFADQGEVKATDVKAALEDFLPAVAFSEGSRASVLADPEAAKFVPPGQKLHTYKSEGSTFEVYCSSLADPQALEIVQNMQILVPLYIEGGTILELELPWIVERWKLFLLYKVDESASAGVSKYSLAGYSTSFRTFTFHDRQKTQAGDGVSEQEIDKLVAQWADEKGDEDGSEGPLGLPSRERLSQFIILPPYQGKGLGSQLYNIMYAESTTPANVVEFTVEDPNEAFDDMRDVCDLVHLRAHNDDFARLKINTGVESSKLKSETHIPIDEIVDGAAKERIRLASKIMPRQLARLIEMQTLSKIPHMNRSANRITRKEKASNENDRAYYFWRLYVKQRLYIHNRDTLVQLGREERIEKLEGAIEGLQGDYQRLLELADKRAAHYGAARGGQAGASALKKRSKKRKADADDGDGEAGDETQSSSAAAPGARKRRAARVVDDDEDGEDIGEALDE